MAGSLRLEDLGPWTLVGGEVARLSGLSWGSRTGNRIQFLGAVPCVLIRKPPTSRVQNGNQRFQGRQASLAVSGGQKAGSQGRDSARALHVETGWGIEKGIMLTVPRGSNRDERAQVGARVGPEGGARSSANQRWARWAKARLGQGVVIRRLHRDLRSRRRTRGVRVEGSRLFGGNLGKRVRRWMRWTGARKNGNEGRAGGPRARRRRLAERW